MYSKNISFLNYYALNFKSLKKILMKLISKHQSCTGCLKNLPSKRVMSIEHCKAPFWKPCICFSTNNATLGKESLNLLVRHDFVPVLVGSFDGASPLLSCQGLQEPDVPWVSRDHLQSGPVHLHCPFLQFWRGESDLHDAHRVPEDEAFLYFRRGKELSFGRWVRGWNTFLCERCGSAVH